MCSGPRHFSCVVPVSVWRTPDLWMTRKIDSGHALFIFPFQTFHVQGHWSYPLAEHAESARLDPTTWPDKPTSLFHPLLPSFRYLSSFSWFIRPLAGVPNAGLWLAKRTHTKGICAHASTHSKAMDKWRNHPVNIFYFSVKKNMFPHSSGTNFNYFWATYYEINIGLKLYNPEMSFHFQDKLKDQKVSQPNTKLINKAPLSPHSLTNWPWLPRLSPHLWVTMSSLLERVWCSDPLFFHNIVLVPLSSVCTPTS